MTSELPSDHKAVLIDAVVQTLSERESARRATESQTQARMWQEREFEELRAALEGRTARSWQEADELLTRSARRLGRSPDEVREQASMLGLGAAVDYREARARVSER